MERNEFLSRVCEELKNMSVKQKDIWILNYAKLASEEEQEDFILSLEGRKLPIDMPSMEEISLFCQQVKNGELWVEYETHYCEFDEWGHYKDDWETWYNDPCDVFGILNKILWGCHNLIKLEKYDYAYSILNKVCSLQFEIRIAEDSEDTDAEEFFTIEEAFHENLINMDKEQVSLDWCIAFLLKMVQEEKIKMADTLVEILEKEICKPVCLSKLQKYISVDLFQELERMLEEKIKAYTAMLEQYQPRQYYERSMTESKLARCQYLKMDMENNIDLKSSQIDKAHGLEESWRMIKESLKMLSYEPYIDDQLEIDEVWNICEELLKRTDLAEEDWKLRKRILKDIIENGYYDEYGCSDPLGELSKKLYVSKDETLEVAAILYQYSFTEKKGAELYKKCGKIEYYIEYLENHLGKACHEYVELIKYYSENGKEEKAVEIAEEGIKKCKDDLTEFYIFLLTKAKRENDMEKYKKLYASAKRRKKIDIKRIENWQ